MRLFSYLFSLLTVLFLVFVLSATVYIRSLMADLPDYEVLSRYEPPVTTRFHASDGSLMAEYAYERRLYLPIEEIPDLVKQAFLSAEDKTFYEHSGVNYLAILSAAYDAGMDLLSGRRVRVRGASTITQQVAKNFLLTRDRTIDRKLKEIILSYRIERTYTKNEILELYLNEIFFGLGSYGVAGASLAYYDKGVRDLDLHEAAYLAALPKGPNNYHPYRRTIFAIDRRDWVLDRMVANGFISATSARHAKELPLGVTPRFQASYVGASHYFAEEVRREILARYGEGSLYEGGLSVRTTLSPSMQQHARDALRTGLVSYDRQQGYRGAYKRVEIDDDWGLVFGDLESLSDVQSWRLAVVLESDNKNVRIGLDPGRSRAGGLNETRTENILTLDSMKWARRLVVDEETTRFVSGADDILSRGDIIYVSRMDDGNYRLEQIPEVSGALVAMDPHTGRVLAMMGGFSFSGSQFNRATQARRQPGSSFKPFVYATALDNGYTPSSVILDGPIQIDQGEELGIWEPKNYTDTFDGPQTLRRGIERSRNLMTVRLAGDMGMDLVAQYARHFGLYDYDIFGLAASLGSHETTLLRMVSAYSVIANGGSSIKPSLIDRIQNRYGETVYRHDDRFCFSCNVVEWDYQSEPELVDTREQVLDPMTSYQMITMMEGVVQRGTARRVSSLGVPIAGKTGTTNEERDAWFIGFTPDLVVGVYIGYDQPRPMGKGSTGGVLAAPVFIDFMEEVIGGSGIVDFRIPDGMTFYPISARTGLLSDAGTEGVIMEAFKPGTHPPDKHEIIGLGNVLLRGALTTTPEADEAVLQGTGGLY